MGYLALTGGIVHAGTKIGTSVSATLVLRDGVVVGTIEAGSGLPKDAPVEVINVAGLTVLPGLIDCHVHLFFDGGLDMTRGQRRDPTAAARRAAEYLRAGVTTVRDLGAPVPEVIRLRDGISAGRWTGPRIRAAGPIVTVPGGHGAFAGAAVADPSDLPATVHRLADTGVDCLKVAVSGGVSTPGSDLFAVQFDPAAVRAVVAAGHARGLPVAAHASNPAAVRIAAEAGVDSVEHAVLVDDAAVAALADSPAVLVPTLAATARPETFLADPAVPEFVREKAAITIPAHRVSARRAIAAGVRVAAGTDGGSTGTGHALTAGEAAHLVACGLPTERALAAVTSTAAALLGLPGRIGTLTPGAAADVVVVAGDPIRDITALERVRLVIKAGEVVHCTGGTAANDMLPKQHLH